MSSLIASVKRLGSVLRGRAGLRVLSGISVLHRPNLASDGGSAEVVHALLRIRRNGRGLGAVERAIDAMAQGESVQALVLPNRDVGKLDVELAACMATIPERLMRLGVKVRDEDKLVPLRPEDIAIVVPHRVEVGAVQASLPARYAGVSVATADAFQGQERRVIIARHPLSGRAALGPWDMLPGRFGVELSRHRVGCFLVMRDGVGCSATIWMRAARQSG